MVDITFYRLDFTKGANLRFADPSTVTTHAPCVVRNVRITEGFKLETAFEADFEVSGNIADKNYAVINQYCFWVSFVGYAANSKQVMRLRFERDPWPLIINKPLKGTFSALPSVSLPYQRENVSADLVKKRRIAIPTIGTLHITVIQDTKETTYDSKLFWVEVTTNRSISNNNTDPNHGSTREKAGLYRYGLFCSMMHNSSDAPNTIMPASVYFSDTTTYMSLDNLMSNLSAMAKNETFTDANILDISVSERCPYQYRTFINETYYQPGAILHDGRIDADVQPSEIWNGGYGYEINRFNSYYPVEQTVTITAGDTELCYGNRVLYDTVGNIIATLPMVRNLILKTRCISDYSNMYTVLYNDDIGLRYVLPEGHLPFGGDNWTSYSRLAMNYDRECMQINQSKANADAANSVGTGIANGLLSGALLQNPFIGVATAGVSIGSSLIGRKISIDAEKDLQKSKEKNQLIQAGNTYNVGYGVSYLFNATLVKGAHVGVMMPLGMEAPDLANHAKLYGYPNAGYRSIIMTKGYYQGFIQLFPYNANVTNTEMDILNDELSRGIRLIESRNDI